MRTIKAKSLGPEDDGMILRALASETSGSPDSAPLGLIASHAWTAPLQIITLGRPDESATIAPALRSLAETHGTSAVIHNVRATPASTFPSGPAASTSPSMPSPASWHRRNTPRT